MTQPDKLSSHIKPCPFCGTSPYYGGFPDVRIECTQCKQAIVKASWYGGDLGTMEASWNTRVIPSKHLGAANEEAS